MTQPSPGGQSPHLSLTAVAQLNNSPSPHSSDDGNTANKHANQQQQQYSVTPDTDGRHLNIPSTTRTANVSTDTTPDILSRQLSSQLNINSNVSSTRSSYNTRRSYTPSGQYVTPQFSAVDPQSQPQLHRLSSASLEGISQRTTPLLPSPDQPNTNLYMTGLPPTWTKQTLDTYFAVYGRILESRILHDRYVGLSRGIGFVRFANVQSCYAVIATQHGQQLPGSTQTLNIRFANEQSRRASTPLQSATPPSMTGSVSQSSQGDRSLSTLLNTSRQSHQRGTSVSFSMPLHGVSGASTASSSVAPSPRGISLFCFHIPPHMHDSDLALLFAQYGRVLNASIMRDPTTNNSRGFGFVSVADVDAAENCISHLNGYAIGGKFLKVGIKKSSLNSQQNLQQQIQQHIASAHDAPLPITHLHHQQSAHSGDEPS